MDMVKVFEEKIMKTTEHKLNIALENLKENVLLQLHIRELADVSYHLKKVTYIIKELTSDDKDRKEWKMKQDNLVKKRNELYLNIGQEGFEPGWIQTIVDFEEEQLKEVLKTAREAARKKYLGDSKIKDIDIFDERLDLVRKDIEHARTLYIQGNKIERTQ
ncbi:hypothetical protein [Neobacillus jeddahensis]|uniref:hypothetical protein n=1 Tax=Neobacillus jeddahensis TaxID=1461580 RepID=UPI00058E62C5|nr:hypothetical protein [Neobacillus jeddahensis]